MQIGCKKMQNWMKIKQATKYASVSESTFRRWLKQGLRYVRKEGTLYFKREWIDNFLLEYEVTGEKEIIEAMVNDLVENFA